MDAPDDPANYLISFAYRAAMRLPWFGASATQAAESDGQQRSPHDIA